MQPTGVGGRKSVSVSVSVSVLVSVSVSVYLSIYLYLCNAFKNRHTRRSRGVVAPHQCNAFKIR